MPFGKRKIERAERVIRDTYRSLVPPDARDVLAARRRLTHQPTDAASRAAWKADALDDLAAIHDGRYRSAVTVARGQIRQAPLAPAIISEDIVLLGGDPDRADRVQADCCALLAGVAGVEYEELRRASRLHDGKLLFSQVIAEVDGYLERLRRQEVSAEALPRSGDPYKSLIEDFEKQFAGTPQPTWYSPLRTEALAGISELETELGNS